MTTWLYVIVATVGMSGGTGQVWGVGEGATHGECVSTMNAQMKRIEHYNPKIAKRCFAYNGTKNQYLVAVDIEMAFGGGVR